MSTEYVPLESRYVTCVGQPLPERGLSPPAFISFWQESISQELRKQPHAERGRLDTCPFLSGDNKRFPSWSGVSVSRVDASRRQAWRATSNQMLDHVKTDADRTENSR